MDAATRGPVAVAVCRVLRWRSTTQLVQVLWLFFTQAWIHFWVLQTVLVPLPLQLQLVLLKPEQLEPQEPLETVTLLVPSLVLVKQPL
jgi:hypothetical protein